MRFNFDEFIDRSGTSSSKWDSNVLEENFGERELLPFWVADMDFKTAPAIIDALKKRVEHGIYGYSTRQDSYYQAIIDWTRNRFNWEIKREWIEYTPGIVPAINLLIQTFCKPGDKIIIQQPIYYPFKNVIEKNKCEAVNSPLKFNGEFYEIDFEDFEKKAKDPQVKIFILCSPHNPISRVWTKEELETIGRICLENDILVIADEIHNDLVFSGYKHYMFASLNEEFAMNSITCTATSKTFNLAGMQSSNIIIPNEELRSKFQETLEKNNIGNQNPLSIVATEVAYREGEDWLEELLEYLEGNIKYINEFLEENLPRAKMLKLEATYLGWIDFREYEANGEKLEKLMAKKGRIAMDGGTWFGEEGEGFMRINLACPRSLLEDGMSRINEALKGLK